MFCLIRLQLLVLFLKLAPKVKEPKPKAENTDPNVQKEAKEKKGVKKPPKTGLLMREIHQAAVF